MMLPLPPIAPDADLRDFAFMPLDVLRLRDSELAAKSSGDAFRCAVLLWCAGWHQKPAGSLPDDDDALAQLAGFGRVVKEWLKVKPGAMRGWFKCSDGRLYHPVVTEKAIEAWNAKLEQRWRSECARVKKYNQRHQDQINAPTFEQFLAERHTHFVPGDIWGLSLGTKPECPQSVPGETASKGQGQGDKKDISGAPEPILVCRPVDVIAAFDAILHEIFGVAQSRPNPHATDHVYAQRFLDSGADLDLIAGTIRPIVQRFKAEGQRAPGNLKMFETWIAGALIAKNAPPAEARYANGTRTKPTRPSLNDQFAELDRLCGDGSGPLEPFSDPAGGIVIDNPAQRH